MRSVSDEDYRRFERFRARNFGVTPPHEAGKMVTNILKRFKTIAIAGTLIWGVHYTFQSYNQRMANSWQIQYDISKQIDDSFKHARRYFFLNYFFRKQQTGKLMMEHLFRDLAAVQASVNHSVVPLSPQTVSIERKVHYKFYWLEFGVIEKIRELTYRGDLIQTKKEIPVTIFGIPFFAKESFKIIKKNKLLRISDSEDFNLEQRLNGLMETARLFNDIPEAEEGKYRKKVKKIQQSIKMGYELYH